MLDHTTNRHKGINEMIATAQTPKVPGDDMAGEFTDVAALQQFLLAGKAILSVRSRKTGVHFTFKFTRPPPSPDAVRACPIWVNVLSGPNNETDYIYLGTIWPHSAWQYRHGTKSRVGVDAPSVSAVRWFISLMQRDSAKLFAQVEVWHEGRCGRCGRKLTVPDSVASGFGPECIQHV